MEAGRCPASKLRPVWDLKFFGFAASHASPYGDFPEREISLRPVLRVDVSRWDQTAADLRALALHAPHPRSRERFLALHEVAQGGCATEIATRSGRHPQTVMGWVHTYNKHGPAALLYRRSGGRPPFARGSRRLSAKRSAPPNRLQPSRR